MSTMNAMTAGENLPTSVPSKGAATKKPLPIIEASGVMMLRHVSLVCSDGLENFHKVKEATARIVTSTSFIVERERFLLSWLFGFLS